jgi:hypothetical protein
MDHANWSKTGHAPKWGKRSERLRIDDQGLTKGRVAKNTFSAASARLGAFPVP